MPKIDYRSPLKVLAAVRGHPFDRNEFASLFNPMEGVSVTFVDQPAAALLMAPEPLAGFDALLLYDMPGLDFDAPVPATPIDPPEELRQGFAALLESGKGIVALHHALAAWPAWPEFGDALGGRFLYRPADIRGVRCPDSGYRHQVSYSAEVVAPEHPVTEGLPRHFEMTDELYLAETFADGMVPLLRARHEFVEENFYSTLAAIEGRMFTNSGWRHAPGDSAIAWARRAGNSPLVYLQPGDDRTTYENPHYRKLVENAVRWVASPAARLWAASAEG